MAVLSLGEIPGLKEILWPYGYTIHVHDSCGGQAFTLELLGGEPKPEVYEALESFFASHRMTLNYFGSDRLNFVAR